MAEAFVNDLSGGGKRGTGTWSLNPVVVDVMSEINIDIV